MMSNFWTTLMTIFLTLLGLGADKNMVSTTSPTPGITNPIMINKETKNGNEYTYVVVPKDKSSKLKFYYQDSQGVAYRTIARLKEALEKENKKLLFATNGGIFSTNYRPSGLYIENGEVRSELNTKEGEGNFHIQPNGVFLIKEDGAEIKKRDDYKYDKMIKYGLQSGPMLVVDGSINTQFAQGSTNLNVRSGVGINSRGDVIFLISDNLVSFYDFAEYFRDNLGCNNALYLDGTISEMYVLGQKEIVGQPFGAIIGLEE